MIIKRSTLSKAYEIKPASDEEPSPTEYEVCPGAPALTLKLPTIGLQKRVGAIERIAQDIDESDPWSHIIERAKLISNAPDGFDWDSEEIDTAVLGRMVADFFLSASDPLNRLNSR